MRDYRRLRRHNIIPVKVFHRVAEEQRFWLYVDKRGSDECWPWTAAHNRRGYGVLRESITNKGIPAHRFSWVLHNRAVIPDGLFVLHSCDNPPCVNPSHLRVGTQQENVREMWDKGRQANPSVRWKLSNQQVAEIRRLYAAGGHSQRSLGEQYGVSTSLIGLVLKQDRMGTER